MKGRSEFAEEKGKGNEARSLAGGGVPRLGLALGMHVTARRGEFYSKEGMLK